MLHRVLLDSSEESTDQGSWDDWNNAQHNITPTSVKRDVTKSITNLQALIAQASKAKKSKKQTKKITTVAIQEQLVSLEGQMQDAATRLDFEKAITLREQWHALKQQAEK